MPYRIGEPVIVNTDHKDGQGIHWMVIVKLNRGRVYIYDPLGPSNNRISSDGTSTDEYLQGSRFKVHYFPYASQFKSSDDCGYFAIMIGLTFKNFLNRSNISNRTLDNIIKKIFGTSPDVSDVKKLERAFA